MSWQDSHRLSEEHASNGDMLLRSGDHGAAARAYGEAARAEQQALEQLHPEKPRTLIITALNAISLFMRAQEPVQAEMLAYRLLSSAGLSPSAQLRVRNLLREAMNMQDQLESGNLFLQSRIELSVDGGHVSRGAAPLSLIEAITKRTEALIYRVAEYRTGEQYRLRGHPSSELLRLYPTWLLQSSPGSYRFAVGIPESSQPNMFSLAMPSSHDLVGETLSILTAATLSPGTELKQRVTDEQYRGVFLRLARDLAPTGRSHELLEIGPAPEEPVISLDKQSRLELNEALKKETNRPESSDREEVKGVLRAVDLEHDWLLVIQAGKEVKIWGVGETVDDVIGPMMNRPVIVSARRDKTRLRFQDIEPDE